MRDRATSHGHVKLDIAKFQARPWYREPWPWIIIAGPASAVVAGVTLLWLAIGSNDGLVVDDYYRQGLAVNQVILRDQAAFELRYRAQAVLSDDSSRIRIFVSSASGAPPPEALRLRLAHPTRAGKDQSRVLAAQPGGDATACAPRIAAMNLSWHLFPHPHPFSRGEKGASCSPPERGSSWVSYEASLLPPEAARWVVTLEDLAKTWRLSGNWHLPAERAVVLEPSGSRSSEVR